MGMNWKDLYASNQAQIRAALAEGGITMPSPGAQFTDGLRLTPGLGDVTGLTDRLREAPGVTTGAGLTDRLRGVPGLSTGAGLADWLRMPPALGGYLGTAGRGSSGAVVHVPASLDPDTPVPLVCMLHGCKQDPAMFAAATGMNDIADRHGFVVVYPGQGRADNAMGCWNWFLPEHQRRDSGEPAAIAEMLRDLIDGDSRFTVDPERVFVAGLSSGGAMALILALCYPDVFAGVAVHSGLPYGSATDVASAFQVMGGAVPSATDLGRVVEAAIGPDSRPVPSIVIHGTADRTVAPVNAKAVLRQSMTANQLADPAACHHDVNVPTNTSRAQPEAGHTYTRSQWADDSGTIMHELLEIDPLGHAWSGGTPGGSYTDPRGPSASEAISEFFSLTRAPAYAL